MEGILDGTNEGRTLGTDEKVGTGVGFLLNDGFDEKVGTGDGFLLNDGIDVEGP
jgi:hypothetical protein